MPTRKKSIRAKSAKRTAAARASGSGDKQAILSRLVTMAADRPAKPTKLKVTFRNGKGMLTATLFQNITGSIIGHDSVATTGVIVFNNASSGDVISVNGVCTGTAEIDVDVATTPGTPVNFPEGNINFNFLIN